MKTPFCFLFLTALLFFCTSAFTQPANDACTNATLLTLGVNACATTLNGTTQNATASSPAVQDCLNGAGVDVWYKFVPQLSGLVNIRITNPTPGYDLYVTFYAGTCGNFSQIFCTNDLTPDIQQTVVQNTTYYLKISETNPAQYFNFTLCGFMIRNDECTDAYNLTVGNGYCTNYAFGTTSFATQSTTVPLPACGGANATNDDVWYRFTAPIAGNIYIATSPYNQTFDQIAVQVYRGTCGALMPEQCNDVVNTLTNYMVVNSPAAGTEYFLRVFTPTSDPANYTDFVICVNTGTTPPNDDCSNATEMPVPDNTCTQPVYFTTMAATASSGPVPNCVPAGADDDVWASFEASRTGTIRVAAYNNFGNDNSAGLVLEFYTGTSCATLTAIPGLCGTSPSQTFFDIAAIAGTKYYVRAYSPESSPVNFSNFGLCPYYLPTVPANDDCIGAVPVPVSNNTACASLVSSTSFGATQTLPGCDGVADDDVWFSFTATATEQVFKVTPVAATNGISDIVFEVFSGSCAAPVSMYCVNNTSGPTVESTTLTGFTIGDTYYVRVYSHAPDASSRGDFTICIATAIPATANLLANGSFEDPVQTNVGDHYISSIPNWQISNNATSNLIKVNSSSYTSGPDTAHEGVQYIAVPGGNHFVSQTLTLASTASVRFGGWFSRREVLLGTDFSTFVEILDAGTNAVVATSATVNLTAFENQELWKEAYGNVTLAAGNYVFRFQLTDYANCDDAYVTINDPTVALVSITASAAVICANANVVFTATAINGGTAPVYAWQKNGAAIANSNSPVYNDNTLLSSDVIICKLTSNDPLVTVPTVVSNSISIPVTTNCYCIPPYNSTYAGYFISNVTMNGVSNTTTVLPPDGYNDFTATVFNAQQATVADFRVSTTNSFAYVRIWIDYNDNQSFEDAGELVFAQKHNGLLNIKGFFYIPADAPAGDHRIRIRSNGNSSFTSCEQGYSGETEDYTLHIAQGINCNGTPAAAVMYATQYVVCSGDSTQLIAYANGLGITYQWQKSNLPATGFTDIAGASSSIYSAANITSDTYYRCVLSCSGATNAAGPLAITIGAKPVNDSIFNAIPLVQNIPVIQNTTCATSGEENLANPAALCSTPNNTVWYKFIPAITGRLVMKVEKIPNDPYPIDAWIVLFKANTGCPSGLLTYASGYPFNCLRANLPNDSALLVTTGTYLDFPQDPSGILQADSTYFIMVDGYIGSYGAFKITALTASANYPNSWTGNVSTDWNNAANWSNNTIPDATTDVIIYCGRVNYPRLNATTTIRSLSLKPGATYTVGAGASLIILH